MTGGKINLSQQKLVIRIWVQGFIIERVTLRAQANDIEFRSQSIFEVIRVCCRTLIEFKWKSPWKLFFVHFQLAKNIWLINGTDNGAISRFDVLVDVYRFASKQPIDFNWQALLRFAWVTKFPSTIQRQLIGMEKNSKLFAIGQQFRPLGKRAEKVKRQFFSTRCGIK